MKKTLFGATFTTMTLLYAMLSAIVILVCLVTGTDVLYGIIGSIIILILQLFISPWLTDLSMKWFYKVEFDGEIPEYLKQFISETCKKHNMKYPRIGVIDDGAPNAFTYGVGKNSARVVFTRGLYELLSEEEVKAVVAHEIGHATHYDMVFMTMAQLIPLVLYAIYEAASSDNDNDSKGGYIAIIAYILYIISEYIVLWVSRTREYYADSFAIEETKNPTSLANALVKIGYGLSINSDGKKSKTNALGIFDAKTSKSLAITSYKNGEIAKERINDAMKWERWNVWAKIYELNSTHPLISKRLDAISKRCKEFNQEEYIKFNAVQTESYVDDFFLELIIWILPSLVIILGIILCFVFMNYIGIVGGLALIIAAITSFFKLSYTHKVNEFPKNTVAGLLGEVKVSGITSIPCTLEGTIIGRGNPGCILNEDFVVKDETGIMFLDYNQPLFLINKIFAIFKSEENFNKIVKVKGWYRRSPVPYVEIYQYEIDGKVKKCHTYTVTKVLYGLLIVIGIVLMILGI